MRAAGKESLKEENSFGIGAQRETIWGSYQGSDIKEFQMNLS